MEKKELINLPNVHLHTMQDGTHMQVASWGYEDNELRKLILGWLEKLENNQF